jgi:serine/threonine protein kinase/WD40 repeat protein
VNPTTLPADGSFPGPLEQFEQAIADATDAGAVLEAYKRQYPELAETFGKVAEAMAMLQATSTPHGGDKNGAWAGPQHPERFGPYKIVRSIGSGGMGEVYEAVEEPLGRRVAIKTLRRHATNPSHLLRFDRERRTLARLHHTNVVPIYATGSEGDLLYFAMPYLAGVSLGQVIKTARSHELSTNGLASSSFEDLVQEAHSKSQSASNVPGEFKPPAPDSVRAIADRSLLHLSEAYIRTAVQVTATIAEGLHHAHQAGIVHRDIKPGNIIIQLDGHAWLLDFGLASLRAKPTAGPLAVPIGSVPLESDASMTMGMLGTPGYTPEEQQLDAKQADVRSDVWALGATLFELLTLQRAFRDNQAIREAKLTPPRRLTPSLDRQLEAIVLKALSKDPPERYPSAQALADDLNHWLAGKPVSVWPRHKLTRPPWRLWLWSKRNKGWATAIAFALVGLSGLAVVAEEQRHHAEERAATAQRQFQLLEAQQFEQGDHKQDWWRKSWDRLRDIPWKPEERGIVQGLAVTALGGVDASPKKDLPIYAQSLAFDREGRLWLGHTGMGSKAWHPETDRLESWPLEVSGPLAIRADGAPWQVGPTYPEPDNPHRRPLEARPNPKFPLQILDVTQQKVIRTLSEPREGDTRLLAWTLSPNGSHVAAVVLHAPTKQQLLIWDANAGRLLHRIDCESSPKSPVLPGPGLAFAPDASVVATWVGSGRVDVWNVANGRSAGTFRTQNALHCVAFGVNHWNREAARVPAERWMIAAGGVDGLITLWNPATRGTWQLLRGAGDETRVLAFSPDGTMLASAGRPHGGSIWDVATGRRLLNFATIDYTTALAFSPDGTHLASSSWYPFERNPSLQARTWILALDQERGVRHLRGIPGSVWKVVFSRDGKRVAALSKDWWAGVWERDTGRLIRLCAVPRGLYHGHGDLALSPDARSLAVAAGNTATLWDLQSGQSKQWALRWGLTDALAFPDAGHLMLMRSEVSDGSRPPDSGAPAAKYPRACSLRNLLGQQPTERLKTITDFNWHVESIAASPDGRHFVVNGIGGTGSANRQRQTRAYRADGELVAQLANDKPLGENAGVARFDPSGRLMIYDSGHGEVVVELPACRLLGVTPIAAPMAIAQDARVWLGYTTSPDYHRHVYARDGKVLLERLMRIPLCDNALFSPDLDGRYLLWGNDSGIVFVADLVEIQRRLTDLGLGW